MKGICVFLRHPITRGKLKGTTEQHAFEDLGHVEVDYDKHHLHPVLIVHSLSTLFPDGLVREQRWEMKPGDTFDVHDQPKSPWQAVIRHTDWRSVK